MDDPVTYQVVTWFYTKMFKWLVIDVEYAAEAPNTAVIESAGEASLEKRIVFVHVGI